MNWRMTHGTFPKILIYFLTNQIQPWVVPSGQQVGYLRLWHYFQVLGDSEMQRKFINSLYGARAMRHDRGFTARVQLCPWEMQGSIVASYPLHMHTKSISTCNQPPALSQSCLQRPWSGRTTSFMETIPRCDCSNTDSGLITTYHYSHRLYCFCMTMWPPCMIVWTCCSCLTPSDDQEILILKPWNPCLANSYWSQTDRIAFIRNDEQIMGFCLDSRPFCTCQFTLVR